MKMTPTALSHLLDPDCARCASLCCVLLSFDRGEAFAFNKAWGVPCRNLARDMTCTIHEALTGEGMAGCVAFDCQGAGPRAVRAVFDGEAPAADWHQDEARAVLLSEVFAVLRKVHALLELLGAAQALGLDAPHQKACAGWIQRLVDLSGGDAEALGRLDIGALEREVHTFLRSLAVALPSGSRRLPVLATDGRGPARGREVATPASKRSVEPSEP